MTDKTRNMSLFAGLIATVIGLGAVSTASSAFAMGCLTDQDKLPPVSLSHDPMVPGAGFGYDKSAYDAAAAKGNVCPSDQQSLPNEPLRSHPNESNNNGANSAN